MQNSVIEEIEFIGKVAGLEARQVHHFPFGRGDTKVTGNTTPVSLAAYKPTDNQGLVVTRVDLDGAADNAGALNVATRSPNFYPADTQLFWQTGNLVTSQKSTSGVGQQGAYHLIANSSCFFVFRSALTVQLMVAFFSASPCWFNARVNGYLVPVDVVNRLSEYSSTVRITP